MALVFSSCKETKSDKKLTDSLNKETLDSPAQAKSGGSGFNISAPDGWEKSDTFMMGQKIVFIKSAPEDKYDNFFENVNVVIDRTRGLDEDAYLNKNIEIMEESLTDFEKKKISTKNINGLEFKSMEYSHVYGGVPLDVEVYFTFDKETAYVITCTAKKGSFSKWEPEFEEIIKSFSLN
jgi:hypothetical protein